MTPGREMYFAKCSKREMWVRRQIAADKRELSNAKIRLKVFREELLEAYKLGKWFAVKEKQQIDIMLKVTKYRLAVCKRELARLKGFDRVVEPKIVPLPPNPKGQKNVTVCKKCGTKLIGPLKIHCPGCGRYIMWWRLKLDG